MPTARFSSKPRNKQMHGPDSPRYDRQFRRIPWAPASWRPLLPSKLLLRPLLVDAIIVFVFFNLVFRLVHVLLADVEEYTVIVEEPPGRVGQVCLGDYHTWPRSPDDAWDTILAIDRTMKTTAMTSESHLTTRRRLACVYEATAQMVSMTDDARSAIRRTMDSMSAVYFDQYIQMAREMELVYFHHISKNGGTALCREAWVNGCRPPGAPAELNGRFDGISNETGGGNCWSRAFGDKFTWFPDSGKFRDTAAGERGDLSCSSRLEFAVATGLNFMANEGFSTTPGGPCKHKVLSAVSLREPLGRTLSHVSHLKDNRYYFTQESRKCETMMCYAKEHYIVADNYMVRVLGTRSTFEKRAGELEDGELREAKEALKRFDVVLSVGASGGTSPPAPPPLYPVPDELVRRVGLGWAMSYATPTNKRTYAERFTDEDKEFLVSWNALDLELYEFGMTLHRLDAVMYNRSEALCRNFVRRPNESSSLVDVQELEGHDVRTTLRHVCPSFVPGPSEETKTDRHYMTVLAERSKAGTPFSCGCGWAGSNSKDVMVPLQVPLNAHLPAKQACPASGPMFNIQLSSATDFD